MTCKQSYFIFKDDLNDNETLKFGNKFYLKLEFVYKFNSYIKLCYNTKLIDRKYPLLNNPKISIILPIYKGGKYLNYSLRSIQNQKMKDIEIIIIDDYSPDDSLLIINRYMKDDPRIRLIKNSKNKKILYSKSIAALNSNGRFILELDQDDMFIRDDVFDILYFEAQKYNLDLVQIRDFVKNSFFFKKKTKVNIFGFHYIYPKKTHYKTQPELKDKLFIDNNNYLLWCLLIKTDLYKKAIYIIWPFIINYKIIFNEDYIVTFIIILLAKKYKYINKFALIHLAHKKSISNEYWKNNEFYMSLYFYAYYLYNLHIKDYPKDIKILINYVNTYISTFANGIKIFPELFNYILKKVFNNDYLSFHEKKNIIKNLNVSINIYKIFNSYNYPINSTEYINILNFQNMIRNKKINKKIIKKKMLNNTFEISIIIYCNEYKFLEETISSILNQIDIKTEIIIINDSQDKININYIKNLDLFDNIKFINNKNNRGLLYSLSRGILMANGMYILILQSGYTLSKENILISLYNVAKNSNIDILEFNLLINNKNNIQINSLSLYKCLHFKSKIDLKYIKMNKNSINIEQEKELLFNKLIKNNIYKKVKI